MAARRRHGVPTRCGAAFAGPEAQCARPVNGLRHILEVLLDEENATIESPQSANSRRNNQEGEHRNTSFWAIGASTVYHAAVAWPVQSETCN